MNLSTGGRTFLRLSKSAVSIVLCVLLTAGSEGMATPGTAPGTSKPTTARLSHADRTAVDMEVIAGTGLLSAVLPREDDRHFDEDGRRDHGEDVGIALVSPTSPGMGTPGV